MNREKITQIINSLDEKYIDEATRFAVDCEQKTEASAGKGSKKNTNRKLLTRFAVAAACLLIFAALGITVYTVTAEAREYRQAVEFFEENGLSITGLTRTEVKEVYRDITAKSFTYGKTANVIRQAVQGLEILQKEPTPEELSTLWDINIMGNALPGNGIKLIDEDMYEYDPEVGADTLKASFLKCYMEGDLLWTAEFPHSYCSYYKHTEAGTAVAGFKETMVYSETLKNWVCEDEPWIAVVDDSGTIKWQSPLEHGFKNEIICAVLRNNDGTWAVFHRGDLIYLCLSYFDDEGNELSFHKTEVGNRGVWNAAHLGEGYILQMGTQYPEYTSMLCKMDREGNLQDNVTFEFEDVDCHITDMAEFGGQVFLSGYTVRKQRDTARNHELADILDEIFEREDWNISGEELTPKVRDHYEAMLLLCDPEANIPKTYYSVKGSVGGRLEVEEDHLLWDVESITSTFFSPATDSFTIGGSSEVFRYTFNSSGAVAGQEDTGETVPFRK